MYSEASYIVGHHGTSEEAAKSIVAGQFRPSLSGRYGPGVYFWCEENCSKCMATVWAEAGENPAVLRSEIQTANLYDLIEMQPAIDKIDTKSLDVTSANISQWTKSSILLLAAIEKVAKKKVRSFIAYCHLPPGATPPYRADCPKCVATVGKSAIVRDVSAINTTTLEARHGR